MDFHPPKDSIRKLGKWKGNFLLLGACCCCTFLVFCIVLVDPTYTYMSPPLLKKKKTTPACSKTRENSWSSWIGGSRRFWGGRIGAYLFLRDKKIKSWKEVKRHRPRPNNVMDCAIAHVPFYFSFSIWLPLWLQLIHFANLNRLKITSLFNYASSPPIPNWAKPKEHISHVLRLPPSRWVRSILFYACFQLAALDMGRPQDEVERAPEILTFFMVPPKRNNKN